MKKLLFILVSLTLASASVASWAQQTLPEEPEVVGVLMYADWCGLCKVLEPKLEAVKQEFQDQPILFTRFDLTDEYTISQSARYAALLGLGDLFVENRNDTGYMELVEWPSRRVLATLNSQMSPEEIRAALNSVLE